MDTFYLNCRSGPQIVIRAADGTYYLEITAADGNGTIRTQLLKHERQNLAWELMLRAEAPPEVPLGEVEAGQCFSLTAGSTARKHIRLVGSECYSLDNKKIWEVSLYPASGYVYLRSPE